MLKGQLASISAQLDGLSTAAPALRKGYDRASVELALNRQNRMQSIRNFGLEWYSHTEVRRYLPSDLLLSQDKEFCYRTCTCTDISDYWYCTCIICSYCHHTNWNCHDACWWQAYQS